MRNCYLVRGRLNRLLALLVLVFAVVPGVEAQPQTAPAITVTVNKSMVFRLAERAKRVSVSQPEVADVLVVSPSQLLINGKNVGTTSLIIFDEKGAVSNYDLIVAPDIAALRAELRSVFPDEKVDVSTSGASLVLRGEVSNENVYDKVLDITATYLPPKPPAQVSAPSANQTFTLGAAPQQAIPTSGTGFAGGGTQAFTDETSLTDPYRWADKQKIDGIIDLLVIREMRQVELDVVVAEVGLSKLQDLGIDFFQKAGSHINTGSFAGSNSLGNFFSNATPSSGTSATTVNVPPVSATFSYVSAGYQLLALLRLLQNKDFTQILAQPRLVTKNGRSAGFLAGGEFPVVSTTANTFGVIFKPFGVRLDFVPTITWSNRIDLRVFPEVSQISSVSVLGVPGVDVRRTVSRVELKEGESLIIGGLLDRRIVKDMTKFPWLGDIPILGTLFRSTHFQNNDSELVFVITPRIVGSFKPGEKPQLPSVEKYDDPDIRQVPVPGGADKKKPAGPGASIP